MAQTIIQIIDQLRQSLNKAQLPDPALRQALSEVLSKHSQEDINETVTTSNDQTLSLLHVAIYVANTPIIDDLIEQGADVNSTDAEKLTPLELALDKQLPRLSKQLIQKAGTKLEVSKLDDLYQYVLNQDSSANMPDLTNKDESKITSALILAIQTNNPQAIDQLCEYTNINNPFDQDGNTLLHLAINEDRADVVKQLLNKGADTNAHNRQENPPLFAALTPTKPNDSIVQELMHFGAQAYGLPKELTDKCPESITQIVEYTSRVINDEIARKMRNLGYSSTVAVVCFGLAEMAKQAHLIDNINNETNTHIKGTAAFDARLELLAKIPDDIFEKHDTNTSQPLLLPRNQQIEAAFSKLKQEYANTNTTFPLPSDLDNCLIDLQAFFDGISLYQNPNNSPELFDTSSDLSQTASPAKQILMPSILENDPPQEIANFPGVYDLSATESIQQYLQGLHQLLGQTSFTLDITNLGHRIQLSYNHRVNQWCLMDANQLPPKYFNELHILSSDTDELKRFRSLLRQAISKPQTNHGTINTQIFVNQSDALKLANRDLANINQQNNDTDQLQKLHQVYSDQIKAWPMHQLDDTKVSQDPTIMSIACQCGHKDIAEHLVKLPTYQDDKVKLKAPVNSALLNNHPDIVKTLQPHLSGFDEVCLLADSINPHSNYETFKAMLELFDTKPPHNLEIDWEFALLEAAKLGYETYVNDLLQFESNKEHNLVKEDTIPDVIVNALRKNHLNIAETIVQELPNRASSSSIVPWGSLYQAYGLAKQKNCHSVTDYVAAKLKYCPDDLKIAYLSPKDSNNTNKNKTSGSVLNKIKGWLSYHSEQLNSEQIEHNLQPIYQDNTALKYDIYSKLLPFTFEQHNYKLTEALLTCVENDNAISLPFKSLITLAIKKDNSSQFFELIHDKRDSICQSPNSDSYQNDIKQHALVHLAAQDGHLDALKHLIDNYDDNDHSLLNATNEDRLTPLQVAAKNGQTQIVTTLIDHYKQSVNQATQKDQNDLLALAVYSGSQELVDELIHNYGFKVNEEHNNLGQTALHIAAKEGHLELANHLIDNHEAYINAQDNNQDTPLSLAIARQATSSEQDSELVTIIREKMDQYNSTPEDDKTESEESESTDEIPERQQTNESSELENIRRLLNLRSNLPDKIVAASVYSNSEEFKNGICFGLSEVVKLCFLTSSAKAPDSDPNEEKAIDILQAQLEILRTIPTETLENLRQNGQFIGIKQLDANQKQSVESATQQVKQSYEQIGEKFPLEDRTVNQNLTDIYAIVDTILAYQRPTQFDTALFKDDALITQPALPASDHFMPDKLYQDPPTRIADFLTIMEDSSNFVEYLSILESEIGDGNHNFTLSLSNSEHRIQLNFNSKSREWQLFEQNTLFIKAKLPKTHGEKDTHTENLFDLINMLSNRLLYNTSKMFSTQVFVNNSAANDIAEKYYQTDPASLEHELSEKIKNYPPIKINPEKLSKDYKHAKDYKHELLKLACTSKENESLVKAIIDDCDQDIKVEALQVNFQSETTNIRSILLRNINLEQLNQEQISATLSTATYCNPNTFDKLLDHINFENLDDIVKSRTIMFIITQKEETHIRACLNSLQNHGYDLNKPVTLSNDISYHILQLVIFLINNDTFQNYLLLIQSKESNEDIVERLQEAIKVLLEYNPPIDIILHSYHNTNNPYVKKFLENKVKDTEAELLKAIEGNQTDETEKILQKKPLLEESYLKGLYKAIACGHKDSVSVILQTKDISHKRLGEHNDSSAINSQQASDKDGRANGEIPAISVIASKCSRPKDFADAEDNNYSILHIAALYGQADIVKMLIDEYKANDLLNTASNDLLCTQPIHLAAQNGHTETVKILIQQYGVDPASLCQANLTPLHLAAENGYEKTVQSIIQAAQEKGYSSKDLINKQTVGGDNVIQYASRKSSKASTSLITYLKQQMDNSDQAEQQNRNAQINETYAVYYNSSNLSKQSERQILPSQNEPNNDNQAQPVQSQETTKPEETSKETSERTPKGTSEKPGKPPFQELSDNSQSFFARNSYMPTRKGLTSVRGSSETFDPNVYVEHIGEQLVAGSSEEEPRHDQGYESVTVGYRDNETTASQPKTTLNHHQAKEDASDDNYKSKLNENLNELKASLNKDEVEYLHYKHANPQIGEFTHYLPQQETSPKAVSQQRQHPTSKASKRRVHDFQTQQANAESLRHIINKIINEVGIYTINIDQIDDDVDNPYSIDMGESKDNIELQLTNKQLAYMIIQEHNAQLTGTSKPEISVKSRQLETIEQNIMNKLNQKDIVIDNKDNMPRLLLPTADKSEFSQVNSPDNLKVVR